MDDSTFDNQTATDWINIIEGAATSPRDDDIYPKLRAWITRAAPAHVLDIGCGQGICSQKIPLSGRNYIGVDPSPYLVDRAKQIYSGDNRQFLIGNAYDLPFPEATFDAAFAIAVWHLLSDLHKAAKNLSRILKPGGHFLIVTANPASASVWKKISAPHDVLYFYSLDDLAKSLQDAGLQTQKTEVFRPTKAATDLAMFLSIEGHKVTGP